jgi:uncharacterized membrane protein
MKIYLSSILYSILLFFAPIKGIIILVAAFSCLDTLFGIWKAKKIGEKISSKAFRTGFVPKVLSYIGVVMAVYGSDVLIVNSLIYKIVDVEFMATKIIALTLIINESKSMDESWEAVKGYSFIDKTIEHINNLKKVKKQL